MPVDDFAQIDGAPFAAAPGRRNQRLDLRPFLVREITGVTKPADVDIFLA